MPLPSPTITSAVKLNRRPPLTTLETRLIATTRSRNWLFSPPSRPRSRPPRSSRRPRPSRSPRGGRLSVLGALVPAVIGCSDITQSFRYQSSEFQPTLARGIRQRGDPAAVGVPTAVEDHGLDARRLGALSNQLTNPHTVGLLVALDRADVRLD